MMTSVRRGAFERARAAAAGRACVIACGTGGTWSCVAPMGRGVFGCAENV
jgi:Ni,Fe-hydrogenase I small subunit